MQGQTFPENVLAAMNADNKLEAIKLLRDHKPEISLKEANQMVSAYMNGQPISVDHMPSEQGITNSSDALIDDTDLPLEVVLAMHADERIKAVKLLRKHQPMRLKKAKQLIDGYMKRHPEKIVKKPGAGMTGALMWVMVIGAIALLFWLMN